MAVPVPPLRPSVGFCIQTESAGNPPGRWYLNVCKHKMVEMPVAYSGKIVSREHILAHGIGNMQVPFDIGSFRKLKARAEGAKQTTYCIDAVFNPLIVALFMDDEFCNAMSQFRPFVINLALKRIEDSIGVKLQAQQVKLVKSLRYKDGEDGDASVAREFAELAGEQDSFDSEMPRNEQASSPTPEPLIQDLTPMVKKPVIKKGFLNKSSSELYGPEGSGEGVLPENAGDPMGWMPKGLRKTCKIVDTNSPDWEEHEKKKKAAEQTNSMNEEFRDTITKDMEKWAKAAQPDKWQQDLPDGTEPPSATQKYEVDYSRFNKIAEADEPAAAEARDWYCDANGNYRRKERQSGSPSGSSSASAVKSAQEAKSELQKGFLSKAKTPLYPEDEGTLRDQRVGDTDIKEVLQEGAKLVEAGKATMAVKTAERKAPEFELKEVPEGLQLIVSVPGLASMQGVNLDVTEKKASLAFPLSVALRPVEVLLPKAVVPTSTRAKFSRKTQQISITLPCAVPGG